MSIQDLGSIGELIAAIATIATLVYLALQIRQNNRNLEEGTAATLNQCYASINARLSSDGEFAEIFVRGRDGLDSLNPVEVERFRAFIQDLLNIAVYADGLSEAHNFHTLHYSALDVVGSLYNTYPGIREIIDSVEASTPRNLVQRLRDIEGTYSIHSKKGDA